MTVLLVLLPVWLLGSGAAALWYYFHLERKEALVEQARFAKAVSIPLLQDDLRKVVEVIGERNLSTATATEGLSRAASMIEGLLGPSNTGYAVRRTRGPADFPILQVSITGKSVSAPAVWVICSYDSPAGSRGGEANASGLAATVAAAQALAGDQPDSPIHFIFLPHVNDLKSPVAETAALFSQLAKASTPPTAILCVEAMGAGEELWLSSQDIGAQAFKNVGGLGKIYGSQALHLSDGRDLASALFEMGLPAVRVATRSTIPAGGNDEQTPDAAKVAAASGRLIELIRRCATK